VEEEEDVEEVEKEKDVEDVEDVEEVKEMEAEGKYNSSVFINSVMNECKESI